jgi:endonuclease/exonuclease/phosphatase (EEP) superfamily protein YafD
MESRRKVAALLYCVTASCYAAVASEEIEVDHGIVDVFAFQEALLIVAAFGIVLLTMIWVGFRRWLQYKAIMGRLLLEQTAQHAAQYGAQIERVEARLKAVEQMVTDVGAQTGGQIETRSTKPLSIRS